MGKHKKKIKGGSSVSKKDLAFASLGFAGDDGAGSSGLGEKGGAIVNSGLSMAMAMECLNTHKGNPGNVAVKKKVGQPAISIGMAAARDSVVARGACDVQRNSKGVHIDGREGAGQSKVSVPIRLGPCFDSPDCSVSLGEDDTCVEGTSNEGPASRSIRNAPVKVGLVAARQLFDDLPQREEVAKKPWTSFFKDNRKMGNGVVLRKHDVEGSFYKFSEAQLTNPVGWEYCLVGYFSGKRSGMGVIKSLCNSWKVKYQIHFNESGWIVIKFNCQDDRQGVLENGPYSVYGRSLILKNRPKYFSFESEETCKVPLWVRFPGFPVEAWNENGLGIVGSMLGTPIQSDNLTMSIGRCGYARAMIEIDLRKELKKEVKLEFPGDMIVNQKIIYEYVPQFCSNCYSLGHVFANCALPLKKKEEAVGEGAIATDGIKTVGQGSETVEVVFEDVMNMEVRIHGPAVPVLELVTDSVQVVEAGPVVGVPDVGLEALVDTITVVAGGVGFALVGAQSIEVARDTAMVPGAVEMTGAIAVSPIAAVPVVTGEIAGDGLLEVTPDVASPVTDPVAGGVALAVTSPDVEPVECIVSWATGNLAADAVQLVAPSTLILGESSSSTIIPDGENEDDLTLVTLVARSKGGGKKVDKRVDQPKSKGNEGRQGKQHLKKVGVAPPSSR